MDDTSGAADGSYLPNRWCVVSLKQLCGADLHFFGNVTRHQDYRSCRHHMETTSAEADAGGGC